MTATSELPAYLGQVLDGDGAGGGTCFQVRPGVLVTAWHVLDDLGVREPGAQVAVAQFDGGPAGQAVVRAMDPLHDLAVLTCAQPFRGSIVGLTEANSLTLATEVAVAGVAERTPSLRFLTMSTAGRWQGTVLREDQVLLGRMQASGLVKGMSGAPVRRVSDDRVVGVVSSRYNSPTGWLRDTVWVARAENLLTLLNGIADVPMTGGMRGAPLDIVLSVNDTRVRLAGAGVDVTAPHGGVRDGLSNAIHDVHRERLNLRHLQVRAGGREPAVTPGNLSLRRAGRLLAESFLPQPVAEALASVLLRAGRATVAVRLGVDAPAFTHLPWEALPDPQTGTPLALHPLVSLYRIGPTAPSAALPGPLRIVVAIASPDVGGGPLLDYERELAAVLDAVRAARQSDAEVEIVPFATVEAIRAALDGGGVHVLHLSAHGAPGVLHLEDDQGNAVAVDADTFVAEAVPQGHMPPVISLAACYTDAAGEQHGPSFAAQLAARGACAVIGTQTSVTDRYATRLFASVYGELARPSSPDVIRAVADARRAVQRDLAATRRPVDRLLAALDEWSVVTVLAGAPHVPVLDRSAAPDDALSSTGRTVELDGLLIRPVGQFIGRRAQQRRLPAVFDGDRYAGVVLHGIGGIGKTTLAAEVLQLVVSRRPNKQVATVYGALSVDTILTQVAAVSRSILLRQGIASGPLQLAVQSCSRIDVPWSDRLRVLRDAVLGRFPLLLVLDNFEDNLAVDPDSPTGWSIADPALASLLAELVSRPGASRMMITSRYRFPLPGTAHDRLWFEQVPPMTRAETRKLLWSLPYLERYVVDAEAQEAIWRTLGGHPRSLEYLDALLGHGEGRYSDITARLTSAIMQRLGKDRTQQWLTSDRRLDVAIADAVSVVADDVLLSRHLDRLSTVPGAVQLLAGISVFREPVDDRALLFQVGESDEAVGFVPDRAAIVDRIKTVLGRHGATLDQWLNGLADVRLSADEVQELNDLAATYNTLPRPPLRAPAWLDTALQALGDSSLISILPTGRLFMHRWTASELHDRWQRAATTDVLGNAHRAAASYWQWRVDVWPQDRVRDVHNLEETRFHLSAAGDVDQAGGVAELICSALHRWGAWDREASLIHDTLRQLPADSPRRVAWYHQLGILAQAQGDYSEAERRYLQALDMTEQIDDRTSVAMCHHQLGMLAHDRGDYAEAERRYLQALTIDLEVGNRAGIAKVYHQLGTLAQDREDNAEAERRFLESLAIKEELADEPGLAKTYHQLGMLAQDRGDFTEAERRYLESLAIKEELADEPGLAKTYHQLGMLAQERGDFTEAERRYLQALTIKEQIGDQAGLAKTYHQLGMLAQDRGDYPEAEHRYEQSLAIEEQLGNRPGIATSKSQIALLHTAAARHGQAVILHCEAFKIRLSLGLRQAAFDAVKLAELRREVDASIFDEVVRTYLDEQSAAELHRMLGQIEPLLEG